MKITLSIQGGPKLAAGASAVVSTAAAFYLSHAGGLSIPGAVQVAAAALNGHLVTYLAGLRAGAQN